VTCIGSAPRYAVIVQVSSSITRWTTFPLQTRSISLVYRRRPVISSNLERCPCHQRVRRLSSISMVEWRFLAVQLVDLELLPLSPWLVPCYRPSNCYEGIIANKCTRTDVVSAYNLKLIWWFLLRSVEYLLHVLDNALFECCIIYRLQSHYALVAVSQLTSA
jgi:hypothetical protein